MTLASRWHALLDSLHTAAGTGLDFVQTRVQLFGVELEQELRRARSLVIQAIGVLLLAVLAAGFVGIALIVFFWDSHRELVAILVAAFFAVAAALAAAMLKRSVDAKPRPFDSTLDVLKRDFDALRNRR
ncbi:MAG: phage holin family protein [Steroidobacteraceae bacterium]